MKGNFLLGDGGLFFFNKATNNTTVIVHDSQVQRLSRSLLITIIVINVYMVRERS